MKEKRDFVLLLGIVSFGIALILLLVRIAGGAALWSAGLVSAVLSLISVAFLTLAVIYDELANRKSMVRAYPYRYRRLQRKTVRKLRKLKAEGKLNQNEIQKSKGAFLVIARKCGVDQEQARDDFELEIRRRVG